MAFVYKVRPNEDWERRTNLSTGDFEGWLVNGVRLFTPAKGENLVRFMPPSSRWQDARHYGLDVFLHYGVGPSPGATVLCPFKMRHEDCPICHERAHAERRRDEDLAKQLKVTYRVLTLILNMKDEAQGVMAWGVPYTLGEQIGKAARDRSTGEWRWIDNPTEGFNIFFDKEGDGMLTKYTGVQLQSKSTPIASHYLDWVEEHPVPELLRWRSYDEVKRLYEGTGRGEAPGEEPVRGRAGTRPERPQREREERPQREEPPRREERPQREEPRRAEPERIRRPTGNGAAGAGRPAPERERFDERANYERTSRLADVHGDQGWDRRPAENEEDRPFETATRETVEDERYRRYERDDQTRPAGPATREAIRAARADEPPATDPEARSLQIRSRFMQRDRK